MISLRMDPGHSRGDAERPTNAQVRKKLERPSARATPVRRWLLGMARLTKESPPLPLALPQEPTEHGQEWEDMPLGDVSLTSKVLSPEKDLTPVNLEPGKTEAIVNLRGQGRAATPARLAYKEADLTMEWQLGGRLRLPDVYRHDGTMHPAGARPGVMADLVFNWCSRRILSGARGEKRRCGIFSAPPCTQSEAVWAAHHRGAARPERTVSRSGLARPLQEGWRVPQHADWHAQPAMPRVSVQPPAAGARPLPKRGEERRTRGCRCERRATP